jgi:erythromycin esterase-like protein
MEEKLMTVALKDFVVPLRTLDPAARDTGDLAPVAAVIGDAQIACIGESVHCAREFYLLKDRLFRYLAAEHGFTAFVLESGFPEGLRLNDWVLGGPGEVDDLSRGAITYGLGNCDEMRAQLQWMRAWNAAHDRKVRFYGLDLGGSSAMPRSSVEACLARLSQAPGDEELLARTDLGTRFEAMARWGEMEETELRELRAALDRLAERAAASGDEIAWRCAQSAAVIARMANRSEAGTGDNPRDQFMAETVRWILGREERILVAAHNGHIQRAAFRGNPTLGTFLAQAGKAVVIGATAASGPCVDMRVSISDTGAIRFEDATIEALQPPAGGLEARLHGQAATALGLVDLRRLPADLLKGEMAMLLQNQPALIPVRQAFDALVHIDQVSVAGGMLEALRAEIQRAGRAKAVEGRRPLDLAAGSGD